MTNLLKTRHYLVKPSITGRADPPGQSPGGAEPLSIYQFRHTAQSGGRGKHNRMSLMMRRSPRVNHEVLLRATFLG
jgi:hypothetical protein